MYYIEYILLIGICHLAGGYEMPKYLLPKVSDAAQTEAAKELIIRAIGEQQTERFLIKVDSKETFRSFQITKTPDERISIIGSDAVSVAKAFHHYLKYYLHQDIHWLKAKAYLNEVDKLPFVNISSQSASQFVYYQNVCTWGYSFAWWDWSTWRQHIDWMALMGVSMTIAPIQEQIWFDLYLDMGLTEQEVLVHQAGPAFQSWQRMGNIRGWGGPLFPNYRRMQFRLQQKIIKAQRALGITVALPAFAGHVPVAIKRLFPNASYALVPRWNNFPDEYCCMLFVEPNDELFTQIGKEFLQRNIDAYGTNHIYFADPYNEVNPSVATSEYLQISASNIYRSMELADKKAIWLLQGWMFVKNPFWSDELIAAFLTAPPMGQLLVLDLQSEQFPQYERTHSFHGQPFIWCMLHNFGGTLGMHGSTDIVNTQIENARQMVNSTLIGMGITPEGIYQNYIMYAFALERAWSTEQLNVETWFNNFTQARYELLDERIELCWQLLRRSVYAYQGLRLMRGKYVLTRRPALNTDVWIWYNASDINEALHLLLQTNLTQISEVTRNVFNHDVVDLTRQWLQLKVDQLYINMVDAFKRRQLNRLQKISEQLLLAYDDLDQLLATDDQFLLGRWLQASKKLGSTNQEIALLEFNARNQITTWGPNGQILDYANKQWSGLMQDYYKPRWLLFTELLEKSVLEQRPFNASVFKTRVSLEIEIPFSSQLKKYPTQAKGDAMEIARNLVKRWKQSFQNFQLMQYLNSDVKLIISVIT